MKDLNALKEYFVSLGLDDRAIEKLLQKSMTRDIGLIQQKIDAYQACLQTDQATVVKMLVAHLIGT